MKLEILTPEKIVYQGNVIAVTVPGSLGAFQILNLHAPIISILESGNIVVRSTDNNSIQTFRISGGVVEVLDNKIIVLVESLINHVLA